ncbi:25158_t:CDS:2, partial [Racocetra persica]
VEIFVQQSFTINNLEKKLIKLFQKIEKLEEQEQLKSKWDNNQELQTQTTELIRERDNVQQNLKRNLINFLLKNKQKSKRISELTGGLSFLRGLLVGKNQEVIDLTTQKNDLSREIAEQQRERNRIQAELDNLQTRLGRLQGKFLGSLLRSKKKSEAIKELKAQMVKLRAKLIEKEGQIEDLQNQVDDLNQQLTLADNTIDTLHQELNLKDGEITRLENEVKNLETERDDRPKNIQRELDREKGWWDKWLNDTRVDMQSSANDDKQLPTWVANRHVSFGQLLEWSATLAYGGKGA